ncbi:hypothetical protein AGMMS49546_00360 [Spirochaetia bacterium]|nr:hypothetical protein AGMMS49546_00360 [Spirochaetia bacterium]
MFQRFGFIFFISASLVFVGPIQAQVQTQDSDIQTQIPGLQTQIAISSPSYPVTAGDVYSLTYMAGMTPVKYIITVDYSYRIRVSNLGLINVAGKTYRQLKQDVEGIVTNNYPMSGVQLVMISPGSFNVYINGEVLSVEERTTWAMERLSSLLKNNLSIYSSKRNITITSADGKVKTYDLFKAQRFGDLKEDPCLRPGDVITVHHLDRIVSVSGEVGRPEFYELLPGENIRELIINYANGYTSRADTGRVEVIRYTENSQGINEKIYLTQEDINANYPLQHFDAVYVLSK